MTIRKKIFGGFIIMAAVILTLGIIGIVSSSLLSELAAELHKLNDENDGAVFALEAHYVWRQGLTQFVLTADEFTGSLDPDNCKLGSWLKSDVAQGIDDEEVLRLLREINEPHHFIHTEAGKVLESVKAGNTEEARFLLTENILPKTQNVIDGLSGIQSRYMFLLEQVSGRIIKLDRTIFAVNLTAGILGVVIAIAAALSVTSSVIKPLVPLSEFMKKAGATGDINLREEDRETIKKYAVINDEIGTTIKNTAEFIAHISVITEELKALADGDLTTDIKELSEDDVMGISVKYVAGNLNNILSEINTASAQVSLGARQVAQGSQALAGASTEQAASTEQLSSSTHEIAEKTKTNAKMALKAAELAGTIKTNAEKGSRQMNEMVQAVNDINDASQQIGKVIKTIEDIAFQTNILALNAAVEAARAGAAGKGFAVVAEEVRNLASKSAESAKDTAALIENSIEKAELGMKIAEDTAESLAEIVSGINQSSRLIDEIAELSEEQSVGISQINTGIDLVSQVIQQNSATAQESAAASEQMSGQSAMLEELIARFKLR